MSKQESGESSKTVIIGDQEFLIESGLTIPEIEKTPDRTKVRKLVTDNQGKRDVFHSPTIEGTYEVYFGACLKMSNIHRNCWTRIVEI